MQMQFVRRRSTLGRRLSWLVVAAMTSAALFAPAAASPVLAADAVQPSEHDVACNNIGSGTDSALVWLTTDASGLTVHWNAAAPPAGFGTDGTVVVRACVNNEGAWSQNDTNDGIELFPWSLFGLEADPCPGNAVLGGSVDGGNPFVNTQKQNGISCSQQPTPTPTPTPDASPTPTPDASPTPTPEASPTPTPEASPTPTPQPTPTPTPQPTPTPTPQPTPTPVPTPEPTPTPTGSVLSEVGTPKVTLPPTDTLSEGTQAPAGDTWRLILLAMAGILTTTLLLTPAKAPARRKDR